ncbi:MAG: hypothetical protein OJF49_001355 [Ktedonobacterales bacterium]|nr:MAG: hypothetical protein OJF49_001355 [Ktedonobacterales bacterium]
MADVMTPAPRLTEEQLTGWGLRHRTRSRVATPRNVNEVAALFAGVGAAGGTISLRGGGNSYGDTALNDDVTLNTTALNRILAWDPESGVVTVEPGVTIAQLWQKLLPDGWWPAVVPGASAVTIGGAASTDIHGKNNWRSGSFGDCVRAFDLLLPSGEMLSCSRERNPDLFYAAIGGLGLLGCFTSLTLQARRISSGLVAEAQRPYGSLDALLAGLEEATYWASDLVAWVDTSATGAHLGRGLLKVGRDLHPGEDAHPARTLSVAAQVRPSLARLVPSGLIPRLARPMTTPMGVWGANRAQWSRGQRRHARAYHLETYARANFVLDAIPNWRDTYKPGGLIQHQGFVPREAAAQAFKELLTRSQHAGIVPSLAVLKKHRPDDFLLTYLCDGYSLALDYPVRRGQETRLLALLGILNDIVADYGGRIYLAKDSTLTAAQFRRMYDADALARFAARKHEYDPHGLLSTKLYRRLFADG